MLRLDANTIVLSGPASLDRNDNVRHQMTIWFSFDNGQTWNSRVVDFDYAGYSGMTLVGPDTILLAYDRGNTDGSIIGGTSGSPQYAGGVKLVRINLLALESTTPYEFDWNFNEQAPGQLANINDPSIQDYGPWNQQALVYAATAAQTPQYVAGASPGSSALQLTTNSDEVVLTEGSDYALQVTATESFTTQIVFKTTATSGVIIGTRPTVANWTLQLVNGQVQFSLFDGHEHLDDHEQHCGQRRQLASNRGGARRHEPCAAFVRRRRGSGHAGGRRHDRLAGSQRQSQRRRSRGARRLQHAEQ